MYFAWSNGQETEKSAVYGNLWEQKTNIGQDASENSEQKTDLDTKVAFTQDICQRLKLERQWQGTRS